MLVLLVEELNLWLFFLNHPIYLRSSLIIFFMSHFSYQIWQAIFAWLSFDMALPQHIKQLYSQMGWMRGKRLAGLDFCFGMSHVGAYGIYVTTLFLEMGLLSSWVFWLTLRLYLGNGFYINQGLNLKSFFHRGVQIH